MNMSANMLGLDNAATPLGLKAMKELQELNPNKDTASNPMIMFLVINTSALIIIPISIMVYRAQMGAAQPTDVFIPILLSTFISTLVGVIAVSIAQKINLINKPILILMGVICLFLFGIDLSVSKRFTRGYGYLFYIDSEYSAVQCHYPVYSDGSQEKNQCIRFVCRGS